MEAHKSFWRTYVFSTDHKTIGKQYMLLGLVMAVLGGYLAYVFRMQLAWPGAPVPGYGEVTPAEYNSLITMHGTVMIFWVAMPVLLGGFGNFLLPLMIGAQDMAFPRLNMLSFWVFFVSTVVLVLSFFVPEGANAAGWTAYPPLAGRMEYTGVEWGMTLWILAVALEFAAVLLGGVNFLTTTINMRARGMSLLRMPMFVWMQIVANIIFMFSVGPLIAGAVMLLLDHTAGTSFFMPAGGGDPLLWQHLFWFFGHPEVYVVLLPTLGILAEVLTAFSRKPLFGYRMILIAVVAAGFLSFLVWAHHQFVSGIDPRLALAFSITTIIISVPFAVTIFAFLATLYRASIELSSAMLFALGFLATFLIGGVTGIHLGSSATDIYMHDTYFVVAHFHYTMFPITFFGMFAGLYFWFPKMFGRMLNETLGKIHFALTIVFFNLVFLPLFAAGLGGHHRRISNPMAFESLQHMMPIHRIATYATIGLLLGQIPFVVNFFWSLLRGPAAERNPWRANTLEWSAPSPPGHDNFDAPPVVVRGPYEYSVPAEAEDWLAQDLPAAPPEPQSAPTHAELVSVSHQEGGARS